MSILINDMERQEINLSQMDSQSDLGQMDSGV